jgi:hypothetical protein
MRFIGSSYPRCGRTSSWRWASLLALAEHPDEPDEKEIRMLIARHRERYLRWQGDLLGWAIIVGRKR